MLTGSNDHKLSFKKVNTELTFFYQRWQELLDHRTIDMYRYNILNSNTACLELMDVIDKTMSGLLTSRQNVVDAKAEVLALLKQDDVLSSRSRNESSDDKSNSFYISMNRLK